jgi:DNA polymerase-3 subunit gamma/tau
VSKALYRTYRSKSLDEVVGQSHVTDILSKAIKQGRIAHAYLLTGPRGVGKTSIARILAHEINQLPYSDDETHLDIIEIDAASNNGVEDVRDLRDKVQIAPVSAAKKVYIIDEVHMLSKAAFNALLKTLEEPPEHVVFILATTDVDKLPATIISRTQRFSFRAIGTKDAVAHLRHIADAEKIKIDDESLELIAERGDGSFRDSISLLDQLASLADDKTGITTTLIETSIGLAPKKLVNNLIDAVEAHDIAGVVGLLDQASDDGIGGVILAEQLTQRVRQLVVEKPQLLPLLDSLLDVAKNAQPQLKLLSVLGSAAAPKHVVKTVALATPVLEVSATIAELEKQATKAKPKLDIPTASGIATDDGRVSSDKGDVPKQGEPSATGASPVERTPKTFDGVAFVEHARQNYVAVYSVLSKCNFALEDNILTIYAGNKFYKKKLDDAKYSPLLGQSLVAIGYKALEIHIIPTAPPPSDKQAQAVAAIMGGGEEVSVDAA